MRSFQQPVRPLFILVSLLVALWLSTGEALAETMYVQAKTAQLRAGKTSLDKVTANLQYGDALEVLSRDGNWVEARTGAGDRGWIFAGKVSGTKPGESESELAALGKSFRRKDASSVTASAGARGLDKVSEDYAKQAGITKDVQDAVDRMTAYRLTDQEIEEFLKNGRLGEYAQ